MADVSVSYKDSVIAEMDGAGSKTLRTAGTYCEDDVVVAYNSPNESGFFSITTAEVVIGANTVGGGKQAYDYLQGLCDKKMCLAALLDNPQNKDEVIMAVGSAQIDLRYDVYLKGYRFRDGAIQPIAFFDDYLATLREGARYKVWLLDANTTNPAPY